MMNEATNLVDKRTLTSAETLLGGQGCLKQQEPSVLQQLEQYKDNLIRQLNNTQEKIDFLKKNPEAEKILKMFQSY